MESLSKLVHLTFKIAGKPSDDGEEYDYQALAEKIAAAGPGLQNVVLSMTQKDTRVWSVERPDPDDAEQFELKGLTVAEAIAQKIYDDQALD